MSAPIKRRSLHPHKLKTDDRGTEAWFYTNDKTIELVTRAAFGQTVVYKFRVADMRRIVAGMSKP